jgi:hypothetical protein
LEYYFPIIYGDQFDDEIQRVRDICYERLRDYNFGRMDKEANRGTCASEDVVAIDDSFVNFNNFVSQKKKGGNTKLELEHYLEDDLMPRILDFDILTWWKANGPKYSTLQGIS